MAVAIVTGASSGIGAAICRMLLESQYEVFGLARYASGDRISHPAFTAARCDLGDVRALETCIEDLLGRTRSVDVLVNAAGVGYFGPHETIAPGKIAEMVQTDLLAPMVLTHLLLRSLKTSRGAVVNIASTAGLYPHRFGCAYGAAKAGLVQFGESLFDEVRKSGVRVCTVCPDMSAGTSFYTEASFEPAPDPECRIEPSCVAEAVRGFLQSREGTVQTRIVLRPQRVGVRVRSLGAVSGFSTTAVPLATRSSQCLALKMHPGSPAWSPR